MAGCHLDLVGHFTRVVNLLLLLSMRNWASDAREAAATSSTEYHSVTGAEAEVLLVLGQAYVYSGKHGVHRPVTSLPWSIGEALGSPGVDELAPAFSLAEIRVHPGGGQPGATGPSRRGASVWRKQSQAAVGMQSLQAVEPQGGQHYSKAHLAAGFQPGTPSKPLELRSRPHRAV